MASSAAAPAILDLGLLHQEADLCREVVDVLALAASVTLERVRGEGSKDSAVVLIDTEPESRFEIHRLSLTGTRRDSLGDPQEATEWGAAGIAVGLVNRVLRRRVFSRLPKGTGADYLMRIADAPDDDTFERLEVSGIADGRETASERLREKVRQLASHPCDGAGWAVVTRFHTETNVEVVGKRWSP